MTERLPQICERLRAELERATEMLAAIAAGKTYPARDYYSAIFDMRDAVAAAKA